MDDKLKSPITLMAEALAKMTERAIEAEWQRDAAKRDSDNWYRLYLDKDEQLKDAESKLAACREYIANLKGENAKKEEADNA